MQNENIPTNDESTEAKTTPPLEAPTIPEALRLFSPEAKPVLDEIRSIAVFGELMDRLAYDYTLLRQQLDTRMDVMAHGLSNQLGVPVSVGNRPGFRQYPTRNQTFNQFARPAAIWGNPMAPQHPYGGSPNAPFSGGMSAPQGPDGLLALLEDVERLRAALNEIIWLSGSAGGKDLRETPTR